MFRKHFAMTTIVMAHFDFFIVIVNSNVDAQLLWGILIASEEEWERIQLPGIWD